MVKKMKRKKLKVMLILNPAAGYKRGRMPPLGRMNIARLKEVYMPKKSNIEILKDIENTFAKNKLPIHTYLTKKRMDATRMAKQCVRKRYDIVVAAGGDGTINEVINGLAKSKAKVGIIPLGTANAFAAEFNIPFDIKKACNVIINGKTKTIDLGIANKRYFALCAGIGFDAKTIKNVKLREKKIFGSFAFILAGIRTLFTYKFHRLRCTIDNRIKKRCYHTVVGNGRYYGGLFEVTKNPKIDDSLLDVAIYKGKGFFRMVTYIFGVSFDSKVKHLNVEHFKAKKVRITSKIRTDAHVDAELIGTTPVEIKVVPKALNVIYN